MKKTITLIAAFALMFNLSKAQTLIADFEDLILPADSYYVDNTGADFISNQISFNYDWTISPWGDYWSGGFSYSNMTDSVTSGYNNQYSAKAAKGYNSSANYVVGQNGRPPSAEKIELASSVSAIDAWVLMESLNLFDQWDDGSYGLGVIATVDVSEPEGGFQIVNMDLTLAVP